MRPAQVRAILVVAVLAVLGFVAFRFLRSKGVTVDAVTRRDAAIAIIQARGESPAAGCREPFFSDVPCADAGWGWIEKLRTDGLTNGCDPPKPVFCPDELMNRARSAMFVARSLAGSETAVPLSYGPDPATGRSYSCDPGKPNLYFKDVTIKDIFCQHVHYLWAKGLMTGSADTFGPTSAMTRDEMAKFLAVGMPSRAGS